MSLLPCREMPVETYLSFLLEQLFGVIATGIFPTVLDWGRGGGVGDWFCLNVSLFFLSLLEKLSLVGLVILIVVSEYREHVL